ncbi:MAG: hypothetical protein AB8B87_04985 [Granulosicoccus sp.]
MRQFAEGTERSGLAQLHHAHHRLSSIVAGKRTLAMIEPSLVIALRRSGDGLEDLCQKLD